jgi:hypothetical protein
MAKSTQRRVVRETIDDDTGEVDQVGSTVITVSEFGGEDATGFTPVKYVSVPILTPEEVPPGRSMICKLVDACRTMPPLKGVKSKFPGDFMASTIQAPNGEVRLFPWSAVFRSEMAKAYEGTTYVGKWFRITRLKKTGKNYWSFAITEVTPTRQAA